MQESLADQSGSRDVRWQAGATEPDLPERLLQAERRIAELEAEVAARDAFMAVVGHEMRNPMVPILLSLDRARRMAAAGDTERLRSSLARLEQAVAAFVGRATLVLDLARFNAGEFRLIPEPTDLSALVAATIATFRDAARQAGCELRSLIEPGIAGHWDRVAVQQVVENLLSNALKYGAGGPVEVTLSQRPAAVWLEVRDRGPGIAAADRERIFARFERVAHSGSPGGFGIGLWLVGQVVKAMGGSVRVDSTAGEGSTFAVCLPAAE
jgi:signal transduction histidine kinase